MDFEDTKPYGFNNKSHYDNHLHYLFRTESGQPRTNENTKNNLIFIPKEDEVTIHTFPEELKERIKIEKKFKDKYKDISYEDLCMARSDWPDNLAYEFTDEMIERAVEFIKIVNEEVGEVLLVVAHVDQPNNYLHIHFIIKYYQ